jgi:hypothetical protein
VNARKVYDDPTRASYGKKRLIGGELQNEKYALLEAGLKGGRISSEP